MDDVAGFSVGRQSEQLVDQRAGDANRMAMLARICGHGDWSAIGAKSGGQRFERGDFKMRMIDGQEHRSVGIGWNQSQPTLERAEHAALGIGIDGENNIAAAFDARSNLVRMEPNDDDDWIANSGEEAMRRSRNVSF